jgi:DNA-binding winged helix-turn-helix (wHTH) protein
MRYHFADVIVDTGARLVRRGDQPAHLSPKAFDLLQILLEQRPRAMRKEELYDLLWPATYVVDANLPVLIREIRRALGDARRQIVRTVQRFGYSFAAEAHSDAEAQSGTMHFLIAHDEQFRLAEGENLVGRAPDAAVFIPSASVSRRHAVITISGDEAALTDLSSKNGTAVGDRAVHGAVALADGSVVRFGSVTMSYRRCSAGETDTIISRNPTPPS